MGEHVRDWICQYCGTQATTAQGAYYWCSSPRCVRLHELDTCEPRLDPPLFDATLFQRICACVGWLLLAPLVWAIPPTWLWNYRAGTWRHRMWGWVNANSYWWYERMMGRC